MSPILMAMVLAWALSQIAKVLVGLTRVGRKDVSRARWRLIWAGGMPSSHAAVVTSTLLMTGILEGTGSTAFALAFVLFAIVLHDRAKLFHIYQVLQSRFPLLAREVTSDPMLRDLVGHRVCEILGGMFIGALSAGVVALFWHL